MMKRFLFCCISLLLAACGGGGSSPSPPSVQPSISGWTQFFGSNVVVQGGSFDFPATPGSVHYIVEPAHPLLGQTIVLIFQITGNGTLMPDPSDVSSVDTLPATLHLFLWEKGDNLTGQGAYETYREWSARTVIGPGTFTVSAQLDPSQWTGVFGQTPSAAAFQQLLNNCYGVGFTFGGASFAGHGLYSANGSLHFQLMAFSIQ